MGDGGDWEEAEDVTAGDVHDGVEEVGRVSRLTAGVSVHQTLDDHQAGGEREGEEGDDVPAVGGVLDDQAVEDGAQDGEENHWVAPGSRVEQSATGVSVGHQQDCRVRQDDQSDEGDEEDWEDIPD